MVEEDVRIKRLGVCLSCPYYFKDSWLARFVGLWTKIGTCGTPIIGKKIIFEGKKRKLCGCVMESKTALTGVKCPLNKW